MGSPYFVHRQVNRIHVVKTVGGLARVLTLVQRSMGMKIIDTNINLVDRCCPEWVVIRDVLLGYREAFLTNSRQTIFLEARYEWTGWEKFQRVLILDNCRSTFEALSDVLVHHYELLEDYS